MNGSGGLVLIVIAGGGLWLLSQHKLQPMFAILAEPNPAGQPTLAAFVIALVVYAAVLSALPTTDGAWLTVVLVLGALMYNHNLKGSHDLISTLLPA